MLQERKLALEQLEVSINQLREEKEEYENKIAMMANGIEDMKMKFEREKERLLNQS